MEKLVEKIMSFIGIIKNYKFILSISIILCITTGFILFLPKQLHETFQIQSIKDYFGISIYLIFIILLSIITFNFTLVIYKSLKREMNLYHITSKEKEMIYLLYHNHTYNFSIINALADKLVKEKIIYRSKEGHPLGGYSYCLETWVYKYLKKHPKFFKGMDINIINNKYKNQYRK